MTINKNIIYSDLNPYDPLENILLTNIEAIYISIHQILDTNEGERLFRPEFGANLDSLLFEIIDKITATKLYKRIVDSVEVEDSRISFDYANTSIVPSHDGKSYDVNLVFKLLRGGNDQMFEYSGKLSR